MCGIWLVIAGVSIWFFLPATSLGWEQIHFIPLLLFFFFFDCMDTGVDPF
jgi:hypothetical protein